MNKTSIISIARGDPTLANRYLADQLGEAERSAFEEQMLHDPEILREVEATARFKAGLMQLRDSGELARLQELPRAPTSRLRYYAVAAMLGLLVLGVGLPRWQWGGTGSLLGASPATLVAEGRTLLPVGQTYSLLSTRSQPSDLLIELPAVQRSIELRVLPNAGDAGSSYRVRLSRSGGADVGEVESLQSGADGFVTVYIDSARLAPGRYRLAVEQSAGADSGASPDEYVLSVRAAGSGP